ncbi:MAG: SDR family NAD(P)-dependent oxidoreductase [Flavobacteriales bacterium]
MSHFVIAGGSKGIGLEIVQQLASEGHRVTVISRTAPDLDHDQINFIPFDFSENTELPALPEIIDGLVYCPGTVNLKPFHRITADEFSLELQVNFVGAVRLLQQAFPALKKSNAPSVVLFSTVAVRTGMPFHAGIASAKGAVEGLVKSLAAEWAPTIRVNAIAPSLTDTTLVERLVNTPEKKEAAGKRHPLQRVGETKDIASMATFLLSDKSSWMTGQILSVDGGMGTLKI